MRKKAGVSGRWHDNRQTLITELAENGAGDETIMEIAGHVSRQMLSRYAHIRTEAKRKTLKTERKPGCRTEAFNQTRSKSVRSRAGSITASRSQTGQRNKCWPDQREGGFAIGELLNQLQFCEPRDTEGGYLGKLDDCSPACPDGPSFSMYSV